MMTTTKMMIFTIGFSPSPLCFLSRLCLAELRCTPSGPDHHKQDDLGDKDDGHNDKQDDHDKHDDIGLIKMMVMWMTMFDP